MTPDDFPGLGGASGRDQALPRGNLQEAGWPGAALGECVLIMPADYIPISA